MPVMCVKCRIRESTGVIIAMCDECFDEMDQKLHNKETESEGLKLLVEGQNAQADAEGFRVVPVIKPDGTKTTVLVSKETDE